MALTLPLCCGCRGTQAAKYGPVCAGLVGDFISLTRKRAEVCYMRVTCQCSAVLLQVFTSGFALCTVLGTGTA